jgi:hypothetical protein
MCLLALFKQQSFEHTSSVCIIVIIESAYVRQTFAIEYENMCVHTYIYEKGGFGMYEGGYPTNEFLDPSHSGAAPAVIVVGTDEWLGGVSNKY